MKFLSAALATTLAFACLSASAAPPSPGLSAVSKNISADSGFAVATLSNAGSFEFGLASMFTGVAMKAHLTTTALKAHMITAAQAQVRHDKLAAVKALLDRSLAACQQDNRTGECQGDKAAAAKFERLAKSAYEKLPADPKFGSKPAPKPKAASTPTP